MCEHAPDVPNALDAPGTDGRAAGDAPFEPYGALYIHVPFCVRKCAYCDFRSQALPREDRAMDEWLDDMVLSIRRASREGLLGSLKTVYVGGGTPSHLGLSRLSKLLYTLTLSMHLTPEVECTMEANPESIDERMVKDLFALGVTRISLGVQSFDDAVLRILGRPHSALDAERAISAIKQRFENFSIDIMCGIPGQSLASLKQSVRRAVALGVPHVSVYPLTIEEGTPFMRLLQAGELPEPDPEAAADAMEAAARILEAAGYERYEVASYALPGFACRHNMAYWTGVPYLGLGEGAVSMRQSAERRERLEGGVLVDSLDAQQMLAEDLMLKMRMSRGVSEAEVELCDFVLEGCQRTFDRMLKLGLVALEEGRYRPTQLGWLCGNEIYSRILELAP